MRDAESGTVATACFRPGSLASQRGQVAWVALQEHAETATKDRQHNAMHVPVLRLGTPRHFRWSLAASVSALQSSSHGICRRRLGQGAVHHIDPYRLPAGKIASLIDFEAGLRFIGPVLSLGAVVACGVA